MILYEPKKRSFKECNKKIKQIYEKYLKNEWENMSYTSSCKKSFNNNLLVKCIKALLYFAKYRLGKPRSNRYGV